MKNCDNRNGKKKKFRISYFISKRNFVNNFDKSKNGNNTLFITGLSGSGKTCLSNKLSKEYNAVVLNLDCLGSYYSLKFNDTLIKDITTDFFELYPRIKTIIKSGKYMELKLKHFSYYKKFLIRFSNMSILTVNRYLKAFILLKVRNCL